MKSPLQTRVAANKSIKFLVFEIIHNVLKIISTPDLLINFPDWAFHWDRARSCILLKLHGLLVTRKGVQQSLSLSPLPHKTFLALLLPFRGKWVLETWEVSLQVVSSHQLHYRCLPEDKFNFKELLGIFWFSRQNDIFQKGQILKFLKCVFEIHIIDQV